ncbi:tail fiber [Methylophilales phage MEP401]|nr:tail fiber [Methylophilales phage MEP401]
MSVAINGTNGITFNDGSLQPSAPVGRNLIINGDMAIDQRNAGASATSNATTYMTDRYEFQMSSVTNVQTYQQVTDAPAGFNNSLKITNNSTTQATAAGVLSTPRQKIEGLNTAYLNWGTSDAQTVTISFWVKASVTGTYPVSLINNDFTRSFVTNYTVSVANTWEKKTATIAGDTSGTWSVDNSTGISVMFSLDTGSTYQTTAGSWQTGNYRGTSSDVHFLANASATWQITGVQLEAGTTATPFEHLQYGQQLSLCQRYYQEITKTAGYDNVTNASVWQTTNAFGVFTWLPMRASPTLTATFTDFVVRSGGTSYNATSGSFANIRPDRCQFNLGTSGLTVGRAAWYTFDTDAVTSPPQKIAISAEL